MTSSILSTSLDAARNVVLQSQNPSIAALQAKLRIGYRDALALIAELKNEHIVLCSWPGRDTGLHPDYRRMGIRCIQGDVRLNYIERVAQFAIFYFELAEENNNGHSELVKAQLPAEGIDWREVRRLFRVEWYGTLKCSITEAALLFHAWLRDQQKAPAQCDGVEAGIRARCLPYERPFIPVSDPRVCLDRAYVRLARFFRRIACEDITAHSRLVDWYVPPYEVPQNTEMPNQHPEHVVPCAALRDLAIACFEDHWSIHEVAKLLRRLLVIIWIEPAEKDLLDKGSAHLKDEMPAGWNAQSGCVYARLHDKGIKFKPAPGYNCACNL